MGQLRARRQPLQPKPGEAWSSVLTRQRAESNPGKHHISSPVLCKPANEHMHPHTLAHTCTPAHACTLTHTAHTEEETIAKVLFTYLFLSVMLMLRNSRSTIT